MDDNKNYGEKRSGLERRSGYDRREFFDQVRKFDAVIQAVNYIRETHERDVLDSKAAIIRLDKEIKELSKNKTERSTFWTLIGAMAFFVVVILGGAVATAYLQIGSTVSKIKENQIEAITKFDNTQKENQFLRNYLFRDQKSPRLNFYDDRKRPE